MLRIPVTAEGPEACSTAGINDSTTSVRLPSSSATKAHRRSKALIRSLIRTSQQKLRSRLRPRIVCSVVETKVSG